MGPLDRSQRDTYTYDALDQLTQVSGPHSASFSLDPVGNRTSSSEGDTSLTYNVNPLNQYTQVSGESFSYDPNGNLLDDGERLYAYDPENRLLQVSPSPNRPLDLPAQAQVLYAYDPFGRRIEKQVNGNLP